MKNILLIFLFYCIVQISAEEIKQVKIVKEDPHQVKEQIGSNIDGNLLFTNVNGETKPLHNFLSNSKPTLLQLVYYNCPNLCNLQTSGLISSTHRLNWIIGQEFKIITISIDPGESTIHSTEKSKLIKEKLLKYDPKEDWIFLTGDKENIDKLANQLGYNFDWDGDKSEWIHPIVVAVLSNQGKIFRYLYGHDLDPITLKLSIIESSPVRTKNLREKIELTLMNFDPKKNVYTFSLLYLSILAIAILSPMIGLYFWVKSRYKED